MNHGRGSSTHGCDSTAQEYPELRLCVEMNKPFCAEPAKKKKKKKNKSQYNCAVLGASTRTTKQALNVSQGVILNETKIPRFPDLGIGNAPFHQVRWGTKRGSAQTICSKWKELKNCMSACPARSDASTSPKAKNRDWHPSSFPVRMGPWAGSGFSRSSP